MFKWLKDWRIDRQERINMRQFCAGVQFAVSVFSSGREKPEDYLRECVSTAHTFGGYNHFDRGIDAVLNGGEAYRERLKLFGIDK